MKRQQPDFEDDSLDMADEDVHSKPTSARLLQDLIGRWYWVVLFVILGFSASLYYLSKAPKSYLATSTLLLKQQTAVVLSKDQPEEMDMRTVEAMNTVAERLKRQVLLERIASREDVRAIENLIPPHVDWLPETLRTWIGGMKLDEKKSTPANISASSIKTSQLAGMIGSWMTVSVRRGTRLLDISFNHTSPNAAKILADAVAQEYVAEISGNRSDGRDQSVELLSRKSNEARNDLQKAQKAFSAYVRALTTHEELEKKEREFNEISRRYLPKHPKRITAQAQQDSLQSRFLIEFDASINSSEDQDYWKQVDLTALKKDDAALSERLEAARRLLLSRTQVLRNEIQSQESVFNAMLTKIQQTNVNQAASESELEVNNLANEPGIPVSPVPTKTMAMGVLGGGALGLLIAFICVKIDNKFHTVVELEEMIGLPVIAAVSEVSHRDIKLAIAESRKSSKTHQSKDQAQWDLRVVFRDGLMNTQFAEMFRVLRASITLLGPEEQRKITLFTSSIPGEGKTWTAANYALAAAGQHKKVLLVDLDLRKPAAHKIFGLSLDTNPHGVTGYLVGQASLDECILKVPGEPHLDLMVSGVRAPNPGELLAGEHLQKLFQDVRRHYDVIVVDTPPLLAVPDSRILATFADNLCLVVRAEYVPKGAVLRAIDLLAADKSKIAGLILNCFVEQRRLIGANYSYGYYKYGSKGYAYRYGYGSYGAYGSEKEKPNKKAKQSNS